ncbi:MAG: single-stranded DNA-binding protein [Candidatus Omnitrophica bacterium]|nr:single-stranded DNA-binding protein [Candidatus Omnitrophota bacterium]
MASVNRVLLMGNLTRDPELRYIPNGTAVATLGLAVNSNYTTPAGEKKEEVCFVRVVVWGKQGENCSKYLTKGRQVFVEGRLIYRSWEKDGQTRSILEVRADRVQFLNRPGGPPAAGAETEAPAEEAPAEAEAPAVAASPEGTEDVPF